MSTPRRRRIGTAPALLAAASAAFLASCTQLPDVSPFATATADMAAAVRSAGPAVADEVARMDQGGGGGDERAVRLRQNWQARNDAMSAVVSYSDSLVSIVAAAHDDGAAVGKLADKLGGLAGAAGFPLPGSAAAVGVVTDAAKFVWAQIQLAKGADSLEEALDSAQPAVDRIAEQLRADFRSLTVALDGAVENQRNQLEGEATYNIGCGTRETLAETKRVVLEALAQRAGNEGDDGLTPAAMERLAQIDVLLASNGAQLVDTDEKLAALETRARAVQDLLAASSGAIERWAVAHRDLVNAVKARRPVNLDSLTEAAVEIRDLVKRVREL